MTDRNWAEAFAREWVDAWNAHDLERILSHYTDDFEMTSPLIVERMGVPSGRLKGKEAIRRYWGQGLAGTPDLRSELTAVMVGVNSLAIVYARHRLQECDSKAHGNRAHRARRPQKGGAS